MLVNYLKYLFCDQVDERLHALFFDSETGYLGDEVLTEGARNCAVIRARTLFSSALARNAKGLILAHNHPSGLCRPSADDFQSTDKVRHLGEALDIELLDHLIVARNQVYSMRFGAFL